MKYIRKKKYPDDSSIEDPLSGIANLFDIGLVFIVALIITIFSVFHLSELFDQKSELTIMKKDSEGKVEIITKKGKKIKALKMTKERAKGTGERLGIAYKLKNGSVVYIPDD